jgi:L-ascorbate metabolism protein UlaG (beta-lactamase superfamily)
MKEIEKYERDSFPTSAGDVTMTFLGHGSLLLTFQEKNIYIDPFGKVADYSKLPKADLVLITHDHHDHLDTRSLEDIRTGKTTIVMSAVCAKEVAGGMVLKNGEERSVDGIRIQAVPAYNIQHKRDDGNLFHPRGEGNGYILTLGDKRIYIAGDTENTPEMKALKNIDCAFLPMNLPYTMTPEMVADAALAFQPKVLYPYHFGETNTQKLVELLAQHPEIEVRIRKLK